MASVGSSTVVPGSDKAPVAIQKTVGVQLAGARAEVIASSTLVLVLAAPPAGGAGRARR
jgi:hypothetical protein